MEGDDKIRYSDIIQPDDAIERLIAQLTELNQSYESMIAVIKTGASKTASALKSASAATDEGRKSIDEAAIAAARLERAERELRIAMSETGKEIAWVKAQITDQNKASVEQARYLEQAASSYDRLKADLKQSIALYKSLTEAERHNSSMGEQLLQDILDLKNQIRALDDAMKPHVQTLTDVQKAEQRLAYLQSEEGQRLQEIKAKISELTSARRQQGAAVDPIVQAQERLAYAQSHENEQLKLYSSQIREANQIARLQATIANSAEGSYDRLSAQYALNKIRLNQMSQAEREAADSGKKLEAETAAIYQQMIKLQEVTGNYRLSVGHYEKAFDGLGLAISQVVREFPAATLSLNTFFLGISNNIPYVVDEINKLRAQNKRLQAQGKATINIQKQIVKSLFGWNTALVVVLTTLSMFGSEIGEWIKSLFKSKNAVLSTSEALENIAKELETTNANYGDNIVSLKKLQKEWASLKTIAEKDKWIKDNQTEFSNLGIAVNNVSEAENIFVHNTQAVIGALKSRAKAAAAQKLGMEHYERALSMRMKADIEKMKPPRAADYVKEYTSFAPSAGGPLVTGGRRVPMVTARQSHTEYIRELYREATAVEKAADAYFELATGYEDAAAKELKAAGIGPYEKEEKKAKERVKRQRDLTDTIHKMRLSVEKKYAQSITALEQDEYAKRKKAAEDAAKAKMQELKETYRKNVDYLNDEENKYKELTDEEKKIVQEAQEKIREAIVNTQLELSQELEQIELDRQIAELERVQETIQLRLKAVKAGTEEELRLKKEALDLEMQKALLENKKKPEAERQEEAVIIAGYDKQGQTLTAEYIQDVFDQEQALAEAKFNVVERTEKEITQFKLQQEKERWELQIQLAEAGALEWSQLQIDAAKAAVEKIDRELNELDDFWENVGEKGLGETLLEKLGFKDKQIAALEQAANIVIENIKAIMDAEVEAAEKAVEAAKARVDAAQSAYEAEVEARNNGYANNVAEAKRALQLEKNNQKQKQKLLEEAQKRQSQLDSISQASSLITATANIWSAFSKAGPIGTALAIAAIATMWGSFAAAKIKARQVTADTQEYGEGGFEFLEGGSHASGNDIDLGVKNSRKRRMKAEGGEALVIINKRQTRKYRSVLPEIVNSLNKGVFEEKFANAFSGVDSPINISSTSIDLTTIENSLAHIQKQNNYKSCVLPDGTVIIQQGNTKRIIRK